MIAAAFAAVLPEFVLNSLRPDTVVLNQLFVAAALVLIGGAMQSGKRRGFVLGGVLFGLAHLTRNDSVFLFSLLAAYLFLVAARGGRRANLWNVLLLALAFALTAAPWHMRNLHEIGSLGSPQMARMPFMLEPTDHYAYGMPISLESMLERGNIAELFGKRLFELAAAFKQMAESLHLPLVVLAPVGLYEFFAKANRKRIQQALPIVIWIVGILIIYPIMLPVLNQSGSFKKVALSIMPLLIPFGAIALEKLTRRRWRNAFLLISLVWLAWSSIGLVRQETASADRFYASMQVLADQLEALPDKTGDGELRLMSQDPYVLSVFGYASVVTPLATREDTLELARIYEIDYLLMPAARPALDPLYLGAETDPRYELAAHIAEAGEMPFELYSFNHGG